MRRAEPSKGLTYLEFIREQVKAIRKTLPEQPPATDAAWQTRLAKVREGLKHSIGRTPETACDLAPEILGTIQQDGFAVDRLTFQSRSGVRVTANVYRPDPAPVARLAAVLCVHGHWAWARIDPNVQARCIGLAKLGYVVLCVDAFGAGERAIEPKPGTYHGALDGASLWPTGVSLLGLQVYDNRRAVDYLISRPDVDPKRLAITGASGGGNQTLYAGATDDRFAAVVPVCGIGTYDAYLGTGCCVCEMNVDGLTYATTGDLLAMMAPRALLVINATKDAVQFSVSEAAKSVAFASARYRQLGALAKIKHVPIESGHAYNQPMRESMYGWLDQWLRGKGDGSPVAEPKFETIDPQKLRCYPDNARRPKSVVTIPEFALREGRALCDALPKAPDHLQRWEAESATILDRLRDLVGPQRSTEPGLMTERDELSVRPEPGIMLQGRMHRQVNVDRPPPTTIVIRQGGGALNDDPIEKALMGAGRNVAMVDLRATGRGKPETGTVHGVTDHNEAEWALWVGRPLFGQWVLDALSWIDTIIPLTHRPTLEIVGVGPIGLVALVAAALRPDRVERVGLIGPLLSFVGPDTTPWAKVPMGMLVPGILEWADVDRIAALIAPRRLVIAGPVEPTSLAASADRITSSLAFPRTIFELRKAEARLSVLPTDDVARFVQAFGS